MRLNFTIRDSTRDPYCALGYCSSTETIEKRACPLMSHDGHLMPNCSFDRNASDRGRLKKPFPCRQLETLSSAASPQSPQNYENVNNE